jgi:hypothetical protein
MDAGSPLPAAVRQKRDLTGPLDRHGDLPLMATARTGGTTGPDLAPFGHEPAERAIVFVVHFRYAFFTEKAVLAPA